MIIIIVACALAFGIIIYAIGNKRYTRNTEEIGFTIIIPSAITLLLLLLALVLANSKSRMADELYLKAWEAQRIIKKYDEAIESDDKRMIVARQAEIAVYNNEIEAYKRRSENTLIGCFYPKEVADKLEYIDLESEDLCTD